MGRIYEKLLEITKPIHNVVALQTSFWRLGYRVGYCFGVKLVEIC